MRISTHALREEGDSRWRRCRNATTAFLPTPSARRATSVGRQIVIDITISTHALREEGDQPAVTGFIDLLISTHALREEGD